MRDHLKPRYLITKLAPVLSLLATLLLAVQGGPLQCASVVGSRHDLSSDWWKGTPLMQLTLNNYGEVCVYCHTPHGGDSNIDAPLWNRTTPTGPYTLYSSSTLDSVVGQPSGVSLACLSCHEGTIAVDSVLNAPGGGTNTAGPWYGQTAAPLHFKMEQGIDNCGECHTGGVGHDARMSYLGTDLRNDHPISMVYPTPAQDPAFNQPNGTVGGPRSFANGIKTFTGDKVECASCHNPHDPANGSFLRVVNSGSALCNTCHIK
ncbi:MAG: hypothetical protein HYX75_01590 [Acidobacteria bacterium]|nr:hypothetical protein [Acidobacteriota bacterium]